MIYRVSLVFRLVMPNNVDFVAILVDPFWFEFRKNLNASKPSEHPPQVEECLKV